MSILALFTLAVGLSMDAFAVSVCKGLAVQKATIRQGLIIGIWFGGFQGLMPLIGYLLGIQFQEKIQSIDHWVAFILLSIIGFNMIRESFLGQEEKTNSSFAFWDMFILAVATSIDALAVGITFAFLKVHILYAISFIGTTTFLFSLAGMKIGNIFGIKYKAKAEMAWGCILLMIGVKILMEHFGVF